MAQHPISERRLIFIVGAVQFVNILDFMMVMPLGPDFARALGIPNAHLGLIGGAYTASAALAGLAGAFFLERFDRRKALGVALGGLALGTLAGGFAVGLGSMLAARVLAGMFGGPSASVALAVIADAIPPARRGRAMGAVMGAFSLASVLGVPIGLELARHGGWRLPFFAVAGLGLLTCAGVLAALPPLRAHLDRPRGPAGSTGVAGVLAFLGRAPVALSLGTTAVVMGANFAVIPNISAYLQMNLGYPRDRLGLLYLVGGAISFAAMRVAGALVDRVGAAHVAIVGTVLYVGALLAGFVPPQPLLPVMVVFVVFMTSASFRMVPMTSLTSRVPRPHERASFMSAQSSVQHMSAAIGAIVSSVVLSELPDGRLVGMAKVAWLAVGLGSLLPFLARAIETMVRRHESEVGAAAAAAARAPDPQAAS